MLVSAVLAVCAITAAWAPPPGAERYVEDRPRLAVLELTHDDSVAPSVAKHLGDTLAHELLSQTSFRTLAKDELRSILSPSPWGPVDMTCAERGCLAEVAVRSGASLIAFGTVRTRGGTPVLEAALYDAVVGRVVKKRTIEGTTAHQAHGASVLAGQLLLAAEQVVGIAHPAWLTSPMMGAGTTLLAAGAVTMGAAALTGAAAWVVMGHGGFEDADQEKAQFFLAGSIVTGIAGVVAAGIGIGLGSAAILVE